MAVKFESVLDGISKYLDDEIFPRMNDWQEVLSRIVVGRVFESRENIKNALVNNGIVRTLGVIDDKGNVDIVRLGNDLKKEVAKKSKISITVPLLGNMKFDEKDVDKLISCITSDNGAVNNTVTATVNAVDSNAATNASDNESQKQRNN